jgi:hypothetical protein
LLHPGLASRHLTIPQGPKAYGIAMSALPPDDMVNLRSSSAFAARRPVESMIARWQSLHATVNRLAGLAGLGSEEQPASQSAFVCALEQAAEWQRELAWQGVEDIEAIVDCGMEALAVLEARGQDVSTPALALWREVHAARGSIMAMLITPAQQLDDPAR